MRKDVFNLKLRQAVRSRGKVAVGYLEFSFHRFKPILEEELVEDEGLTTLSLVGCSMPHSDGDATVVEMGRQRLLMQRDVGAGGAGDSWRWRPTGERSGEMIGQEVAESG